MSDVDLSEFQTTNRNGPACAVTRTLAALDDEQADKVRAALEAPNITAVRIAEVVSGWGHRLGDSSVNRHRRGLCRCSELAS